MSDYTPVIFENSLGETVSNDPVYLAQKTLEAQGITFKQSQPDALQASLVSAASGQESPTAPSTPDDPDADIEDSEDNDEPRDYTDLSGKTLAAYAKERGLTLKNEDGTTKKVGAIRTELMKLDADAAETEGE